MPDETEADDGALYDIWARLSPSEVEDVMTALEELSALVAQLKGSPIGEALRQRARDLRDGPLALGHLPLIRLVLAGES